MKSLQVLIGSSLFYLENNKEKSNNIQSECFECDYFAQFANRKASKETKRQYEHMNELYHIVCGFSVALAKSNSDFLRKDDVI